MKGLQRQKLNIRIGSFVKLFINLSQLNSSQNILEMKISDYIFHRKITIFYEM